MNKKKLVNIFKWIWFVIVIAAGVYYVSSNFESFVHYLKSVSVSGLIISIILILVSRLLNVDLIRESVIEVGWTPPVKDMFALISLTQLGKYVPGGIWQFAARFGAYKQNNLTVKNMGKAFLLENIWVGIGGLMGGLFFLLMSDLGTLFSQFHFSISSTLQFILAILSLIVWFLTLFFCQKIYHPQVTYSMLLKRTGRLFASQSLMYLSMGLSFYFLFPGWNHQPWSFIVGGYIISYLAGYLVIFSPGGIGIREAVSIAIFSGVIPQAQIASLTIVHRLLYTLIELLLGLWGFILMHGNNNLLIITEDKAPISDLPTSSTNDT